MSSNLKVANSSNTKVASVFHLNVGFLHKHYDELEALIASLESPPDLLCPSETWLHEADHINCYKITGYNTLLSKNNRGGVLVQSNDNITLIEQNPSELA